MSETARKHGFIDPADVLDRQPGAREVLTVDGQWVPVRRVANPEAASLQAEAPQPRVAQESLGTVAISGLDGSQANVASTALTGGPHPEFLQYGNAHGLEVRGQRARLVARIAHGGAGDRAGY